MPNEHGPAKIAPGIETEVRHFENYDAVINAGLNTPGIDILVEELKDGIPKDWYRVPYSTNRAKTYAVDNLKKPMFVIKTRYAFKAEWKKAMEALMTESKYKGMTRSQLLPFASLINEIKISTKVREITASKPVQDLVKKNGFDSIVSVEPLAGFVNHDKDKLEKFMLYRYVPGENIISSSLSIVADKMKLRTMVEELKELFHAQGVAPQDLRAEQILVVEENSSDGIKYKLILLDIEGYYSKDK